MALGVPILKHIRVLNICIVNHAVLVSECNIGIIYICYFHNFRYTFIFSDLNIMKTYV